MKQYTALLLFLILLGTLAIALLTLGFTGPQHDKPEEFAYRWQRSTNGIIATGSNRSRYFKYFNLYHNVDGVGVAVVGSSRVLSIMADRFVREPFYNYGSHGNTLACELLESLFLLEHGRNLEALVIGVDDLSHSEHLCSDDIASLLTPGASIPGAEYGDRTFSSVFSFGNARLAIAWIVHRLKAGAGFGWEPEAYQCPHEDSLALDLVRTSPGQCDGFRPDGSETFYGSINGANAEYRTTFNSGLSAEIQRLMARVVDRAKARNVAVTFLFTPLKPGLESHLVAGSWGPAYIQTKGEVLDTVRRLGAQVIDGIGSEGFGCLPSEFADDTHPLPACYARILPRRSGLGP